MLRKASCSKLGFEVLVKPRERRTPLLVLQLEGDPVVLIT